MKFIVRSFADGTDFIGTDVHREDNVKAGRRGLGDCICEISNLYNTCNEGDVLVPELHPAFNDFINLTDKTNKSFTWSTKPNIFNSYKSQCKSQKEVEEKSKRKTLMCYPEFKNYIQLDKTKFVKTDIPNEPYATIQRKPFAKKCLYLDKHIKFMEDQYNIKIIEVGGKENLGLAKVSYIIDNAKFHIGIDSGMTHLALTIKKPEDVHIYVPKDRISGVAYRWINYGYKVTLMER